MKRRQIAAANWKMNQTLQQGSELISAILSEKINMQPHQTTLFAVPFPYLIPLGEKVKGNEGYAIAAQNCYHKSAGAYTGEVSVEMLHSVGVDYCIIGHSERRDYFSESNAQLAEKINLCLAQGITPVFCCGEPLPVRESNGQNDFVGVQLEQSLFHLDPTQISKLIIAYEPIWAIGTGRTASSAQAQEMHAFIRNCIERKYGNSIAAGIPLLYGGSVKGANASELFAQPDVDGGLVGGASLNAAEFGTIMKSLK
jgi:triosephosphate isomerase